MGHQDLFSWVLRNVERLMRVATSVFLPIGSLMMSKLFLMPVCEWSVVTKPEFSFQ